MSVVRVCPVSPWGPGALPVPVWVITEVSLVKCECWVPGVPLVWIHVLTDDIIACVVYIYIYIYMYHICMSLVCCFYGDQATRSACRRYWQLEPRPDHVNTRDLIFPTAHGRPERKRLTRSACRRCWQLEPKSFQFRITSS